MAKSSFAELFKNLILKVTAKDPDIIKELTDFFKGIGEMEWDDLLAGGKVLRLIKENTQQSMPKLPPTLEERREYWVKESESAIRVRVLMLANEPQEILNFGMTRWEEAVAVFGLEFLKGMETAPVQERPAHERRPNHQPPVVGVPVTEEKLKELLMGTETFLDNKLKSIRENISNIKVPEVKIPGGLMFAVWTSFVLNLVLVGAIAMTYLSVKSIPEDIDANKQLILKVKSRVESHDKSFKRDSIALVSIQDTLNVRLPKAKAKK